MWSRPDNRHLTKREQAEDKPRGWCMIMLSMLIGRDGLPRKLNGERFREDESEEEDDWNIKGYNAESVNLLIELLHYREEDLVDCMRAVMRDQLEEFKATHSRSPVPLHMRNLYEYIKSGHLYFATATTSNFLITYVGTDLTQPFKKAINKCKQDGVCTFSVTQKARTRQYAFRCSTCFPGDDSMVICEPCAAKCHKGHKVFVRTNYQGVFEKSLMFCDCGDLLDCKCLE